MVKAEMEQKMIFGTLYHATTHQFFNLDDKDICLVKRWALFCQCCPRHRTNRNRNTPSTIKLPKNDCDCHCRRNVRNCIEVAEYRSNYLDSALSAE